MSLLGAMSRRFRLGVLKCDEWAPHIRAKYGDIDSQYVSLFKANGHSLESTTFDCLKGNFPSPKQYKDFDGFVVTGSKYSAYEDHPWISDLYKSLNDLHSNKKKIVGICFGHQAIAQAMGGKVEKVGWNLSHEIVRVKKEFKEKYSFPVEEYGILCVHQDQVTQVPPNFKVWSENDFCVNQGLLHDDETIFTIQAHPEFSPQVLHDLLLNKKGAIPEDKLKVALDTLENKPNNSLEVASWIMDHFFKAEKDEK
eukprot:TRINITY_DN6192_c0_g1_i1.p1 TRINITY_DN6192_c0_g1~~TRINITY_DN6192_c0_g1_i1.p1  ORF type:complete len:253 (+),score=81.23 TRINITY_DN6192_c0_g1_i1:121-879(+)